MRPRPDRLSRLAATLSCILALGACSGGGSGGGGGDDGDAGSTGTVGVLITDGPTHQFSSIEVTISKIELLGEHRVVIFEGSETFDLLQLENFSNLFAITEDVPVGGYEKVRLTVDDLVLVREVDDGSGGTTPETIDDVKLPGGGKMDLNPRGTFFVVPGGTLLLEIDMDAKMAVKVVFAGASEKVIFRPVVFVRVLNDPSDMEKLARVHGTIREFLSDDSFVLCTEEIRSDDLDSDSDRDGRSDDTCVTVNLFGDTSAFDAMGDPVDLSFPMVGDPVTVVGQLAVTGGGHGGSDVDSDSDSDSDPDGGPPFPVPPGGSDGDGDSDSEFHLDEAGIRLDAIVLEIGPLGTFPRLAGEVATAVDAMTDRFDLDLDPGQGFMDPATPSVLLQDGTAVLARDGFRIERSAIEPGVRADVDGVIDESTLPETIRSALVLLGIPEEAETRVGGVIADLDPPSDDLSLITVDEGAVCVELLPDARILLLMDDGSTAVSREVTLADLANGLEAEAFGMFVPGDDCLQAETLIALADEGP